MERNLKLLYACVFVMVAALVGCGGGSSDPQTMNPGGSGGFAGSAGSSGTGGSGGSEVDGDVCAKSLGGKCDEEGAIDPCTNYVCACGEWQDPSNINCPDAGADAEPDADEPDADTPDAQPDAPPPPEEICGNGKDDDGNGKADCQDDSCSAELECQDEVCDGADNNGNGQTDEGFACVYNSTASCQTTCGSFGTMQCGTGCEWASCTPPAENCTNGVDDDCDGDADCEDSSCASHSACQCDAPTVGDWCSAVGEFSCDPTIRCDCAFKWNYAATADYTCIVTETCNGFDDNGNGQADETFDCVKGAVETCSTNCGSIGSKICSDTCVWGACQPPVENCTNGADDDCDGKADCDDPDCSSLLACQDEVCDGVDNNGNGQADEGFACVAGTIVSCTNGCGFTGTAQCSGTCQIGACVVYENCYSGGDEDCDGKANCEDSDCSALPICQPENCTNGVDDNGNNLVDCADPQCASEPVCQPENCTNGTDDDGDTLVDCDDPDCATDVACHDFGTCSAQGAPGVGYECGSWVSDTVPGTISQVLAGCANSEFDQWAIGGTWSDIKALHLTGNHTWSEVALPVAGKVNGGNEKVVCLGQNDVYMIYNTATDGVFLHWNGSGFTRLLENELKDMNTLALWSDGDGYVWLVIQDDATGTDTKVLRWNGSSATIMEVNPFAPSSWLPMDMWGSSSHDIYIAGSTSSQKAALVHWDGYSWAAVQVDSTLKELTTIHGSGSCEVIASGVKEGGSEGIGATLRRDDGNSWKATEYTKYKWVASVTMVGAHKYVLQAQEEVGSTARVSMGTPTASGSVAWSVAGEDFYVPRATWAIPGTSPQIFLSAGTGNNGPEIRRASCQ